MTGSRSALSSRNYLIYLAGSTVSLLGLWVYRVALAWYAWELSRSELWVGIVAATQFAPAVVFGPVFGVLADRLDRKRTSIAINALSGVNMLTLAALTASGRIDIYLLAGLSLVQGIFDGGHAPVRMTIVPNLVERVQLQSAIALTSVSFNLSRFVGPAIAGLIISAFGVGTAFAVNGFSYLALIGAMVIVRLRGTSDDKRVRKNPWAELMEGARYVRRHVEIRGLLIIAALAAVFGRGAMEMLPVFADDVFRGGPSALAMLTSAVGAGAVIGALALSRGHDWLSGRSLGLSLTVAGGLVIVLGLSPWFGASLVVVACLGTTLSFCGIGTQILIQDRVDDEVRGRVSSFWGMIAFGGTSLGSLIVGSVAHAWNLRSAVVGAGVLCLSSIALSARRRARRNSG